MEDIKARSPISRREVRRTARNVGRGGSFAPLPFGTNRQAEEAMTSPRGKLSSGKKLYSSIMKDWELTLLSSRPRAARHARTDTCRREDGTRAHSFVSTHEFQGLCLFISHSAKYLGINSTSQSVNQTNRPAPPVGHRVCLSRTWSLSKDTT